ncbi:unnamed protein product [Lathyrus sativus]|nr:unnamed protein product [Lathyrus sativus]
MFQSPPFSTGNNSQYTRPFMFQPPPTIDVVESPNVESESPIGSTTDSQVPGNSTQDGLENITFTGEGERSTKKNRISGS